MPNWVKNKIYFECDEAEVQKVKDFMSSPDKAFDFNRLIPMPEELNLESGSKETLAIDCAKAAREGQTSCEAFRKRRYGTESFQELVDLGEKYLSNKEKYGFTTWYGWCSEKWGCKWNADDAVWDGRMVEFNTPWSFPEPIAYALATQFRLPFRWEFADEDLGNNCGIADFDCDSMSVDYNDDFEFACDVWEIDPKEERAFRDE